MTWPEGIDEIQASIGRRFKANDWWHYRGDAVKELEDKFAAYHGRRFGVAVCNGTVPLEIILKARGIGPGEKVLVPAFDFYSLPKCVANSGATPVFCDVARDNLTIDNGKVRERLKSGDVKAVVAVHFSSSVAELDALSKTCSESNVNLIEDCAQAAGAVYDRRKAGSWGIASYFSFGGVKLMTSGHGGMILTDDEDLYRKCFAIANRGSLPDGKVNSFGIIGDNFGMPQLCAAALLPQLEALDELCGRREGIMRTLDESIKNIPCVRPVKQFEKTSLRAQMRYCFFYEPAPGGIDGPQLALKMREAGIPIAYQPYKSVTNDERLFRMFGTGENFPVSQNAETSLMTAYHWELLRGKEFWTSAMGELAKLV